MTPSRFITPSSKLASWLLPALILLQNGCADGPADATAAACAALSSCCASLSPETGSTCASQVAAAERADEGATLCSTTLATYQSSGLCGSVHEAAPAPDASASDTPVNTSGAQPSVCSRYLTCVASVTPSALATSLAAYGPNGTCWSSGSTVSAQCTMACADGVATLHEANETDAGACPRCGIDADCATDGAHPFCDTIHGACVACTTDANCTAASASRCDTAANECVTCVVDADCTASGASHCDMANHACVGCASDAQCASGKCNADQTCCHAETTCPSNVQCGMWSDGCGGEIACGACSVGYCSESACTTIGIACTPGGSSCAPGEKCMPDDWHQDYRCAPTDEDGDTCDDIGQGDPCARTGPAGDPVDDYTCVKSVCEQNCMVPSDCDAGKTCTPWSDGGMTYAISPSLPGQCL